MSLRHVLEEQIDRNNKNISAYMSKIDALPKGTLHEKVRGEKVYYYLKYRNNEGKRIDLYVKQDEVENVRKQIQKRQEYLLIVNSLKDDIKIAMRGLK